MSLSPTQRLTSVEGFHSPPEGMDECYVRVKEDANVGGRGQQVCYLLAVRMSQSVLMLKHLSE